MHPFRHIFYSLPLPWYYSWMAPRSMIWAISGLGRHIVFRSSARATELESYHIRPLKPWLSTACSWAVPLLSCCLACSHIIIPQNMGKASHFQAQDHFRFWATFGTSHRVAHPSTFTGSNTKVFMVASAQLRCWA